VNFGGFAKDYHIIGHSLGGHIAGYAGERIENLGRITGMKCWWIIHFYK